MTLKKLLCFVSVCGISISFFGCAEIKELETTESSEEYVTDETNLSTVSVTESESEPEVETTVSKKTIHFKVSSDNTGIYKIEQYDRNGNLEIEWYDHYAFLYDISNPKLRQVKMIDTDIKVNEFENKDLHYLFDAVDLDSIDWKPRTEVLNNYENELYSNIVCDSDGYKTACVRIIAEEDGSCSTLVWLYKYNDNHDMIREVFTKCGSDPETTFVESDYVYEYEYDEFDNVIVKYTYSVINGNKTAKSRKDYEYNSKKQKIGEKEYEYDGAEWVLVSIFAYEYNTHDDLIYYSWEDVLKSRLYDHLYIYRYDSEGNIIYSKHQIKSYFTSYDPYSRRDSFTEDFYEYYYY